MMSARVSCYSETLKGCLCFPSQSHSLCLSLASSLTLFIALCVKVFFEWAQFWLRRWLPLRKKKKKKHHHPIVYVVTNYSPPPFLCPPCNSIFPWNQRDRPRQTLEAQIMPDCIRPTYHVLFLRCADTVDKEIYRCGSATCGKTDKRRMNAKGLLRVVNRWAGYQTLVELT